MSNSDEDVFSGDEWEDTGVTIEESQINTDNDTDKSIHHTMTDPSNEKIHTDESSEESEGMHESTIGRPRVVGAKKNVISDSESEEELEIERRALSPSTRRSIGVFVSPSSDEEEIDEEEENDIGGELNEHESSHEEMGESNCTMEEEQSLETSNQRQTIHKPRLSEFETSIQQKISSTLFPQTLDTHDDESTSSVVTEPVNEVFNISDSLEELCSPKANLLQPKISHLLTKKPESSTPKVTHEKKLISRSLYENECRELDDMKRKRDVLENLLLRRNDFPDKGVKIEEQVRKLKRDIKTQTQKLEALEIDDNKNLKTSLRNESGPDVVEIHDDTNETTELHSIEEIQVPVEEGAAGIDWKKLQAANALVQPKHFGKQGLKTFETQKALTEKRLDNIHGSLNTQPAEDVLHPTPECIKCELMDHQKHGLAWMLWREKNKPRGGILADDMGLGKTLSMIALICEKMENEENQEQDDDSDLDESEGWLAKGRRTHYNGGTLVVCPASLLDQWVDEIEKRVRRNTLSVYVHHGPNREPKAKYLAREDVVITTYNIVSSEYEKKAALFGVKWNRIILDEAHVIRNHKAKCSIASSELRGTYRWALTGTPICNKEMDVYALIRFLRVTPFDDLPTYKRWLEDKKGGGGQRIHALMKTMLLRRTKEILRQKEELTLPDKATHDVVVKLNQNEKNVYSKVLAYSRTLFTEYLQQRGEKGNYVAPSTSTGPGHENMQVLAKIHDKFAAVHGTVQVHQILTLLLRLRQICDHPGLIKAMIVQGEDEELSNHEASHSSLHEIDLIKQLENLALDDTGNDEAAARYSAKLMSTYNPIFNFDNPSSKINSVMQYYEDKVQPTGEKAIFVSQWSSVLKLFEPRLQQIGVKYVSITGEVPVKFRGDVISSFNNDDSRAPKVMLLSLTAGGVGLNLSAANHLFMIDPHWNPQLENQAQDRVYRVGQSRPVNVYKFITVDSIEERIKVLQNKKLELANAVLTGAKNIGSKLTIQDLRSLFEV